MSSLIIRWGGKPVGRILILFGIIYLASAAYDEHRGITSVTAPAGRSMVPYTASRTDDPRQYHNLMAYVWIRASLLIGAGVALLGIARRADELDSFSPDFKGKAEIDDLADTLDEEQRKRQRPTKL